MKSNWAISFLLLVLPSLTLADQMPVVGLDQDHRSFVQMVPEASYLDQMQKVLGGVHRSILPTLEEKSSPKSLWRLRTVAVGINASFTAGLGFLGHVTLTPRFRLVYTNSANPVFPD